MTTEDTRRVGSAGAAAPAGALTEEEIRALLGPSSKADRAEQAPVLLVADGLGEQDRVVAFLRRWGIPAVAVRDGYVALDLLRVGRFQALVLASAALPTNFPFFSRVRALGSALPVCLIRDASEPDSAGQAREAIRPVTDAKLHHLFSPLGRDAAVPEEVRPEEERGVPAPPGVAGPPSAGAESSDRPTGEGAVGAAKAALEARLGGETVCDGLRRWAERAPSVRGTVDLRQAGTRTVVEAVGPEASRRREMVLLLLGRLAEGADTSDRPHCLGPFTLFPDRGDTGSLLALWHGEEAEGRAFLDAFSPLVPLLEQVLPDAEAPAPEARGRFLAFLESRVRAVERDGGRLGVLLVEGGGNARELAAGLRQVLRGGDWVETVGDAVYVVLDQPNPQVFEALGERLRGLPEADRLRVAALGWTPEDGGADEFLARAERLLAEGRRVRPEPVVGQGTGRRSSR